ncbi:hypothetical protein NQ314_000882 [Rhamnusium bicolor]|uniref:Myb/SANT-like DNA-binding domain-containing protein n=1 Tax=Rhamnusium bicolor TaxID=1586634 RepID=A0AAV8ZUP0_9CUCU|nr:hypothetical protein NQ314_000882 [Rhamnusium bicolor]
MTQQNQNNCYLVETDAGEYVMYDPETDTYNNVSFQNENEDYEQNNEENASSLNNIKCNVWDRAQTLLLLEKCTNKKKDLDNPRNKKFAIYKEIAQEMQMFGYNFTYEQCMNRMKTLLTKYKQVKDHNMKSGNSRKTWEYFETMQNYVGDRPNITPVTSCSSLQLAQLENVVDSDSPSTSRSDTESTPKRRKLGPRSSPRVEMLKWLKEYKENCAERENKKMELAERQHNENKEMLSEILSLLKKIIKYFLPLGNNLFYIFEQASSVIGSFMKSLDST